MITSLFPNRWLIGGLIIAVLGAGLYLQTLRLEAFKKAEKAALQTAAQWESNYTAMEATNRGNVEAIATLRAEQEKANQAAADQIAKYNRLGLAYENLKKSTDNTALSPSWIQLYDGLRSIEQSSAGSGSQN